MRAGLKKFFLLIIFAAMFSQESFAESIINTVQNSLPAIVSIRAEIQNAAASKPSAVKDPRTGRYVVARHLQTRSIERFGAGVVIDPSGIIVTNIHTIYNANKIEVFFWDHTSTYAKVINLAPSTDFALIKVSLDHPLKAIAFADSNQLQLGERVYNVGNSRLLKETISGGRVIGLGKSEKNPEETELFQINMNLYKGDSGGPILNEDGKLVGLMVAKETQANRSAFAIPSNKILQHYQDYLKK